MNKKRNTIGISVIVPVFNEQGTIRKIYHALNQINFGTRKEIIFVDDASTDGSKEFLKQKAKQKPKGIKFLFHKKNLGKGAAVGSAWRKISGDYVIVQDADLEYDPRSITTLMRHAKKSNAAVVYGSRNRKKGNKYSYWYLYHGGKMLSRLGNLLYGQSITDVTTCYMLLKREVAENIYITEQGFGLEVEITAKVSHLGIKIEEIPIRYTPRTYKEGKKLKIRDGFRALFLMFKFKFIKS